MQRDQEYLSQEENVDRVTEKISAAVVEFCEPEKEFHMIELTQFVSERVGPSAPDSAGRVLRLLRQSGKIAYSVVSRRNSVYRIIRPSPVQEQLF
jgi:nanoRNase/pAp phosphatase (c-di-AMP/oligoRNAs hydrolase)